MLIFLLIVIILILLFGAAAVKSAVALFLGLIALIVVLAYLASATGISVGYLIGAALALLVILAIVSEVYSQALLRRVGFNNSKSTGRLRDDCPKQTAFTSLGKVEGRSIEEIIAVVGKPNNVTDVINRKVYRWQGTSGKCRYDYTMIVSNDGISMGYTEQRADRIV